MSHEELCGSPGPAGQRCTKPKDHGGKFHAFEIEIPPDLGALMAQHIDVMELRTSQLDRQLRWNKFAFAGLVFATIVNIIGAVTSFSRMLS